MRPHDDTTADTPAPKRRKRRWEVGSLAVIGALALVGGGGYATWKGVDASIQAKKVSDFQQSLTEFYTVPEETAEPGELIRIEAIADLDIPGGTAYRMLYGTQAPDGSAAVSSGMLIVPTDPAPEEGRPVLAWAHGTLGFGNDCTPSRTFAPTLNGLDFGAWLPAAMQRGWVVAATDYTGVGTAGDPYYLIAESEAQDVINSVRAARNFADADAGTRYATFGHSQGGHASLSTAMFADYAPELELVAASAAAPAAQLGALFAQQYTKPVAWGDGPSVAATWPSIYPELELEGVLSEGAMKDYQSLASGCLLQEVDQLILKRAFDEQFFSQNPMQIESWANAVEEQTVDPARIEVPTFVVQSLSDNVVLPNTTALLAELACNADAAPFSVSWLDMVTHEDSAVMGGNLAVDWLQDRFAGIPASDSCAQPLPLAPAQAG